MQTEEQNNESKPWYASTAILGAITSGLISLAGIFHLNLGDLQPQIHDAFLAISSVIATAVTIWGRVHATKKITAS
jgi:hypothetical protein